MDIITDFCRNGMRKLVKQHPPGAPRVYPRICPISIPADSGARSGFRVDIGQSRGLREQPAAGGVSFLRLSLAGFLRSGLSCRRARWAQSPGRVGCWPYGAPCAARPVPAPVPGLVLVLVSPWCCLRFGFGPFPGLAAERSGGDFSPPSVGPAGYLFRTR